MKLKTFFLLGIFSIGLYATISYFLHSNSYMDADYYSAIGLRLSNGLGFTEPFIWNYLYDPSEIPQPSNAYWMPLVSIFVAASIKIFGGDGIGSTQWLLILLASIIPVLTSLVAHRLSGRKDHAITAGFLALFPGFYFYFLPLPDTFAIYMVLGSLFFLILFVEGNHIKRNLCLGVISGLFHLSRVDGGIWLFISVIASLQNRSNYKYIIKKIIWILLGYLLIMGPWLIRNYLVFNSLLSPGGVRALWLTSYNQLFSYPASQINFETWWNSGIEEIILSRLWALGINFQTSIAVQGKIILFPLILIGLWHYRREYKIRTIFLAWIITLVVMTVVFPFAGARGGFFHSGAAFQPLWWALSLVGLDQFVNLGVKFRGWKLHHATRFFQVSLVIFSLLFTIIVSWDRYFVQPETNSKDHIYSRINEYITGINPGSDEPVIVANPPLYYLKTGKSAIALPNGDLKTILDLSGKYDAKFIVLEENAYPDVLASLYIEPKNYGSIMYLGQISGALIYEVQSP